MLWEILIGALVGFIASKIMGLNIAWWAQILLGIAGGAVGGFIANILGGAGGLIGFAFAILGACIVVLVVRKIKG